MSTAHSISQRDLRLRSREIMDAVEAGETFTVTRDGREIGELVPLHRRRRFVPRTEFAIASSVLPHVDHAAFLSDIRESLGDELVDPYAR